MILRDAKLATVRSTIDAIDISPKQKCAAQRTYQKINVYAHNFHAIRRVTIPNHALRMSHYHLHQAHSLDVDWLADLEIMSSFYRFLADFGPQVRFLGVNQTTISLVPGREVVYRCLPR